MWWCVVLGVFELFFAFVVEYLLLCAFWLFDSECHEPACVIELFWGAFAPEEGPDDGQCDG